MCALLRRFLRDSQRVGRVRTAVMCFRAKIVRIQSVARPAPNPNQTTADPTDCGVTRFVRLSARGRAAMPRALACAPHHCTTAQRGRRLPIRFGVRSERGCDPSLCRPPAARGAARTGDSVL